MPSTPVPAGSDDELRRAFAQFATGVAVVSARAPGGAPVAITVNSFASVSLDPPLLLWSLGRTASDFAALHAARSFRVHVLAADQLDVAQRCAQRGEGKFAVGRWTLAADAPPQLDGCVAWFDCTLRSRHNEGDHVVLVGRIEAHGARGGTPLIFHGRRYVTDLAEAPLPRSMRSAPWR